MAFTIPTREEIFDYFIAAYIAALPEKNAARGSDGYRIGRVVSGVAWLVLAKLIYFFKQALPDTAEAGFLERWGAVFAFPRLPASASSGTLVLRVTGTPTTVVPAGEELAHEDGTTYQVTSVGAVINVSGYVDVSVEAISTGEATNKGIGEVLSFTSTPTDLDTDATLVGRLTGGEDIEDIEAYRVRLLNHIADPPQGGAIFDYEQWTLAIPGVENAYIYSGRRGMGTIDIAALGPGTGADRIVSSDTRDAIEEAIEDLRPGNARDFVVLETEAETQDVKTVLEIDEDNYGWDWTDDGTGYAVSAQDTGLSTITVPTIPADVVPGRRIQVDGEEAMVTAVVGTTLTLTFEDDFDDDPVTWFTFNAVGKNVRASGDLVRPVRDAILGYFNSLGPARSRYAKSSWQSNLKLSRLNGVITDVPGVEDCTIVTPVASVAPLDEYGETVPFLIPGKIEVLQS